MPETPVLVVTVATEGSPPQQSMPTTNTGEVLRGASLFRAISRRLAHHHKSRHEEEDDSSSSSSSSSSSGSSSSSSGEQGRVEAVLKRIAKSLAPDRKPSTSSSNSSSTSSSGQSQQPVRRILRQPVAYTYVRGMSGLPTIRVPRSSTCCPNNSTSYLAAYPCEL